MMPMLSCGLVCVILRLTVWYNSDGYAMIANTALA